MSESQSSGGGWKSYTEQITVQGEQLAEKVKELMHEGNVRHLVIKHQGDTVLEIPVTLGAIAAVLAPIVAAVAAVGAVLTQCTIEVVRTHDDQPPASPPAP